MSILTLGNKTRAIVTYMTVWYMSKSKPSSIFYLPSADRSLSLSLWVCQTNYFQVYAVKVWSLLISSLAAPLSRGMMTAVVAD